MYYFVIHFCNFIHYSFKPFKGPWFPGDPVEISISSPLWLLLSTNGQTWISSKIQRCKTILAVVWYSHFYGWILFQQSYRYSYWNWKLLINYAENIPIESGLNVPSDLALELFKRSLRMLMKGVAPIPIPRRSRIS